MMLNEKWENVNLELNENADINFTLQVSNIGRVRKEYDNGKITYLRGSMHDGYSILKLKIISKRNPKDTELLKVKQQQVKQVQNLIKQQQQIINKLTEQQRIYELNQEIKELDKLRADLEQNYKNEQRKCNLERTQNLALLFHRLVATAFCPKENELQNFVLHKDHNKQNNRAENLQWCTQEELNNHWKENPHMKAAHERRKGVIPINAKNIKLTVPKVMLIKKLLGEGMTLTKIAKMFHITSTQVKRIKTGENWAKIAPAN